MYNSGTNNNYIIFPEHLTRSPVVPVCSKDTKAKAKADKKIVVAIFSRDDMNTSFSSSSSLLLVVVFFITFNSNVCFKTYDVKVVVVVVVFAFSLM